MNEDRLRAAREAFRRAAHYVPSDECLIGFAAFFDALRAYDEEHLRLPATGEAADKEAGADQPPTAQRRWGVAAAKRGAATAARLAHNADPETRHAVAHIPAEPWLEDCTWLLVDWVPSQHRERVARAVIAAYEAKRKPSEAEYNAALVGYWDHKHAPCHENSLRAALRAASQQRAKDAALINPLVGLSP